MRDRLRACAQTETIQTAQQQQAESRSDVKKDAAIGERACESKLLEAGAVFGNITKHYETLRLRFML